jgi:hypothetical protein
MNDLVNELRQLRFEADQLRAKRKSILEKQGIVNFPGLVTVSSAIANENQKKNLTKSEPAGPVVTFQHEMDEDEDANTPQPNRNLPVQSFRSYAHVNSNNNIYQFGFSSPTMLSPQAETFSSKTVSRGMMTTATTTSSSSLKNKILFPAETPKLFWIDESQNDVVDQNVDYVPGYAALPKPQPPLMAPALTPQGKK